MSQWLALGGTCACLRWAEGIVATQKVTRDALYGTAACANTAFSHYECPPPSASYKDPCDDSGPTWIIQDVLLLNVPLPLSLTRTLAMTADPPG